MARRLFRCASVQNYLLENIVVKTAATSGTTTPSSFTAADEVPLHIFHSKPTRLALSSISDLTRPGVQDAQEVIRATGATVIVGVDSGVAMDLVESIPGTRKAVMVVQTPSSIICGRKWRHLNLLKRNQIRRTIVTF
eukprot:scaffold27929_cov176-Amphora_coffeaeformis.AAC.6